MHLHFWFRVYICVSFLVCWLFTCWCKRRIVHRSSIFLYVPLHSVNIGVQVVASLGAMRSNECSGSRSRLQPGSGSRRRIACQCLSPTPAKGSAKRRMLENQNGDGRELWTSNNQIDGRVQTANIFHWYFRHPFVLTPACVCFCSLGAAWGNSMIALKMLVFFIVFFILSILMFSLRSRKRHGFMPAFSCLSSGKMEAMTPERHFIWQALRVAGWVQVLILLSSLLILCRDGDCIIHSNSIPSLYITDSGWGPWWCECAGKLLAVDFGLDLLKPLG